MNMERYSGIQRLEGVPVESVTEWMGVTGLEEPMRRLGFGGGADSYPERPDEPDCNYYLRTGYCGYGNRCRFNHPRDRGSAIGTLSAGGTEYPERDGQPVCQYYIRTGMCKFGVSCKYHHPKHGTGSSIPVILNSYGYPFRPGETECSYYIKTGQCKFGVTCKFHHPQPAGIQVPGQATGSGALPAPAAVPTHAVYPTVQSPVQSSQQYGVMSGTWSVARAPVHPGSYVPGSYGPLLLSPGVPVPGWTPYPGPVSQVASPSIQPTGNPGPIYGISQLSPSATAYSGPYLSVTSAGPSISSQREIAFPERPGQPECQYYMRTGDCKFGLTCKYHHPPEWSAPKTNFALSLMGLPLRPGAAVCSHYAQNGVCRFGPSCKFDHPIRTLNYSASASSPIDMPVSSHPAWSASTTLAPTSTSSDLRLEILSGVSNDAFLSPVSSMSSSTASIVSILTKSQPLPQSSVEQSGLGNTSSSSGSSSSRGGKIHTSS